MYIPKLYQEEDRGAVIDFIKGHGFPTLISLHEGRLTASHIPVEVLENPGGTLSVLGHMSRANPQWRTLEGQEVLMLFQGPHTYISPRWYNHVNVPTWNYLMVHAYGSIRMLEGRELHDLLSGLVRMHEADTGYTLEGLPEDFVQKEMKGVAGFRMEIQRLDAAAKLSQNRDDESHASIVRELEARGDGDSTAIAREMRKRRSRA